jgi:hypothetical protein
MYTIRSSLILKEHPELTGQTLHEGPPFMHTRVARSIENLEELFQILFFHTRLDASGAYRLL